MINKVVYSHWSKPMSSENVGFNSKEAFANCAKLSVLTSKEWADVVELVTDQEGYKFLIEDLKLPFDNVRVELDSLNHIDKKHWAIGKIYACLIQEEPFMHLDFDAMWFKRPPDYLLKAQTAFQNKEYISDRYHQFYIALVEQVRDHGKLKINEHISIQDPVVPYEQDSAKFQEYAVNCGFMCFNDLSIIPLWWECALDYIKTIGDNLNGWNIPSIVFEQYFLSKLLQANKITIKTLGDTWVDESLAQVAGYTHLIAGSKRNPIAEEKIAKKLNKYINN